MTACSGLALRCPQSGSRQARVRVSGVTWPRARVLQGLPSSGMLLLWKARLMA